MGGFFLVSQSQFFFIYHKIEFLYKKSVFFFFFFNRFAYIKFDYVMSQSGGIIVHTGLFQDYINNNL